MDPLMSPAVWPPPPPYFPPPPPISAANNNTTFQPPQAEPPYPDMIIAAITALKEREGSSRQAIDRYIQNVYTGNLPSNHPTLLTYHLKRMKNESALSMIKHSYTLPGSAPPQPSPLPVAATDPTTKRGRGRPPKQPSMVPFTEQQPSSGPNAENMLVSLGLVDGPGPSPVKRGRGRPRLGPPGPFKPVSENKPRGRPPRVDRGATRPPRVAEPQVVAGGKQERRGRPRKKVVLPGSKPRGRPRKFPIAVVPGGGGGGGPGVGMKRGRGRLPKAAGGGQVKRVSVSGKPMGRPRKDAISPATQLAAQHLVAYQDLMNKYLHFQSRVKQAVDLVRPYFTSETTPYVFGALQELEQLANMDMTAPAPVQPPPQALPQQLPFAQS